MIALTMMMTMRRKRMTKMRMPRPRVAHRVVVATLAPRRLRPRKRRKQRLSVRVMEAVIAVADLGYVTNEMIDDVLFAQFVLLSQGCHFRFPSGTRIPRFRLFHA